MQDKQHDEAALAKIKGPVLVPLAVALAVLLMAFFTVVWVWSGNQQQRELVDAIERFDDVLYKSMADQRKLLIQNQAWVASSLLPVLTGVIDFNVVL